MVTQAWLKGEQIVSKKSSVVSARKEKNGQRHKSEAVVDVPVRAHQPELMLSLQKWTL